MPKVLNIYDSLRKLFNKCIALTDLSNYFTNINEHNKSDHKNYFQIAISLQPVEIGS